ncbi:hypothetical protein CR201_G0029732 [Pongo abelii]|uniref:Uncharacterized protein n=1 Tax=Pongo abelii TaxID=9601 RepID=A0A2J8U902_PONAB|nr:hypothetical protein CR201_G0029732 [Pongo abelii]
MRCWPSSNLVSPRPPFLLEPDKLLFQGAGSGSRQYGRRSLFHYLLFWETLKVKTSENLINMKYGMK